MASVHPGGEGGRRRRGSSLGSSSSGIGNSNRRNRDDGLEMEPHFRIVSGVHSSPGGKRFQEDMAVKIDDFNKTIREHNRKFTGNLQVRRSFYAIFDGHGGARCSKFLAENFHVMLAKKDVLADNPEVALELVWLAAEEQFYEICMKMYTSGENSFHKSGSTATIIFIVGDTAYIANCGDSHAYLFKEGRDPVKYTDDHNTDNPAECDRVRKSGATVEQEEMTISKGCCKSETIKVGKFRVEPGGLAVTRSFGDFHSKLERYGGKLDSILSKYDQIRNVTISENFGFCALILASDGAWDALSAGKIWKFFSESYKKSQKSGLDSQQSANEACEVVVERCCTSDFWTINNYSADNTTAIAVIFKTRPDPVDEQTQAEMREQAEMDAALAATTKALEVMGLPDVDEEEEEPNRFRRNRLSGGENAGGEEIKASSNGGTDEAGAVKMTAAEKRQARRRAAEGAKKSVSFAEEVQIQEHES